MGVVWEGTRRIDVPSQYSIGGLRGNENIRWYNNVVWMWYHVVNGGASVWILVMVGSG